MTVKIEGVPESISRDQYTKMFTDIGLDPGICTGLHFGADSITAVVFATHPDTGARVLNQGPDGDPGYLKHKITIHIQDEQK